MNNAMTASVLSQFNLLANIRGGKLDHIVGSRDLSYSAEHALRSPIESAWSEARRALNSALTASTKDERAAALDLSIAWLDRSRESELPLGILAAHDAAEYLREQRATIARRRAA